MPIAVTFHGKPLELVGEVPGQGVLAQDFKALKKDLSEFVLSDVKGKKIIISAVPSLDTPVCSLQTKKFNQEVARLTDEVVLLTISMDLPFAQGRFCEAEKIDHALFLSDHREADFGKKYGILIQGLRLLARSVFVINTQGVLAHVQIVPEITQEPDYQNVLEAVQHCS